ncbi:MAG: hypothetical protein F6K19_22545 [Cyanothece sp. SIO1E1]|nr:hypothetical protein [Cyanothece sp. SIO1E1]
MTIRPTRQLLKTGVRLQRLTQQLTQPPPQTRLPQTYQALITDPVAALAMQLASVSPSASMMPSPADVDDFVAGRGPIGVSLIDPLSAASSRSTQPVAMPTLKPAWRSPSDLGPPSSTGPELLSSPTLSSNLSTAEFFKVSGNSPIPSPTHRQSLDLAIPTQPSPDHELSVFRLQYVQEVLKLQRVMESLHISPPDIPSAPEPTAGVRPFASPVTDSMLSAQAQSPIGMNTSDATPLGTAALKTPTPSGTNPNHDSAAANELSAIPTLKPLSSAGALEAQKLHPLPLPVDQPIKRLPTKGLRIVQGRAGLESLLNANLRSQSSVSDRMDATPVQPLSRELPSQPSPDEPITTVNSPTSDRTLSEADLEAIADYLTDRLEFDLMRLYGTSGGQL